MSKCCIIASALQANRSSDMSSKHRVEPRCVCTCCFYSFSSLYDLKRHQLSHLGVKLSRFAYGKESELSTSLESTTEERKLNSNDKQFICFLCNKQPCTSGDKNNHIDAHCRVKHQSTENYEKIANKSNLTQHGRKQFVHVKQKLQCDKCFKTFSSQSELKRIS